MLVGVAQREHTQDLRLAELRRGGQQHFHVIVECPIEAERDLRRTELRIGTEMDARQERIHLVKRRQSLTDLEDVLDVVHRAAALHAELAARLRVARRAAKMRVTCEVEIIERRAVEMDAVARMHVEIEQRLGQFSLRIRQHRHRDLALVKIQPS